MSTTVRRRRALVAAVGVLGLSQLVCHRYLGRSGATVWRLGATASLLGIARYAGVRPEVLGLGRRGLGRGAGVGLVGATGVAGLFGAVLAGPRSRRLFDDDRPGGASRRQLMASVGLHIPWGTVLFEEVAFRAVLPALITGSRPGRRGRLLGLGVSSLLFGCWHLISAGDLKDSNDGLRRARDRRRLPDPVLLVMATTALGGAVLAAARQVGGHLLAPALMHLSSNVLGAVIAWARTRGPA